MHIGDIKPENWKGMLQQANSKNTGKKHTYLGISKQGEETYIHNFSSRTALERNPTCQTMSIKEIYEINSKILTSGSADAEISNDVEKELNGFFATKVDKWQSAKFANSLLTVIKIVAYISGIFSPLGSLIDHLQQTSNLNQNKAEWETLKKYAKIPAALQKIKAYMGEKELTQRSKQLFSDHFVKNPELIESFDKFFGDEESVLAAGSKQLLINQLLKHPDHIKAYAKIPEARQKMIAYAEKNNFRARFTQMAVNYFIKHPSVIESIDKFLANLDEFDHAGENVLPAESKNLLIGQLIEHPERLDSYSKIAAMLSKVKAYAGENFLRAGSKELLIDHFIKYPEVIESFDRFIDAAVAAKTLNLEILSKENHIPDSDDPHNVDTQTRQLDLTMMIAENYNNLKPSLSGQAYRDALDKSRSDLLHIVYQITNASGCLCNSQFHDDNFVFAYNKTKLEDVKYKEPRKVMEQPILALEDRYIDQLLTHSNLYDYEKLRWIEDNWSNLVEHPDQLEAKYSAAATRTREMPETSMRLYGTFISGENDYNERLERLLTIIKDSSFDHLELKEAIFKIQREHGYFLGGGDGYVTKAHWDYTSSESQAFITGTRTVGLMSWDHDVEEVKVDLDLRPLGPLSDSQCREYFLFMQGIDNGDLSRWDYLRARTENSGDVEAAMALLSPRMTAKLDDIAGKLNIDRVPLIDRALLLDIAINYSYKVTKGIALLFANKEW